MTNPPEGRPLRLVQVGLGGWGRSWMKVLHAEPRVRVVAQVDADPGATEADAALVTTGAASHAPVALALLDAGLPVLVEKPFAPTLAEARGVVEAAAARGLPLMVSQNYRFHPAPRLAAALVRAGELGEVGAVEVDFRRDQARAEPAATAHHALADPLLMDMAIHHFDLLRFVLGREPVAVQCRAFNPPWSPFRDPASAFATIEFEGGLFASYRGSWASSGPVTPWAGEWRLDAARAELRWTSRDDPPPDRVEVRPLRGAAGVLALPDVAHLDRAGALAAFVDAVRGGTEPESSGRDNLGSLALALAAVRSAREGRAVPIEEILTGA